MYPELLVRSVLERVRVPALLDSKEAPLSVFLSHSPLRVLRQSLSLSPGYSDLARLWPAGPRGLSVPLALCDRWMLRIRTWLFMLTWQAL